MNGYVVYVHYFPNGKRYYGISNKPFSRWNYGQGYRNNRVMYSDILKYGWDNIQHLILFDNLDKRTALAIEGHLISTKQTYLDDRGYNINYGGEMWCLLPPKARRLFDEVLEGKLTRGAYLDYVLWR